MKTFKTDLEKILSLSKLAAQTLSLIQFNTNVTTSELADEMGVSKAKMRCECKLLRVLMLVEEYNDINGTYGKRGIQYTSCV